MPYISREGERINSLEWAKLYRQPQYSILRRTTKNGCDITTSWVGVVMDGERKPTIFFVWARTADDKVAKTVISECWCETEQEALARHSAMEAELGMKRGRP